MYKKIDMFTSFAFHCAINCVLFLFCRYFSSEIKTYSKFCNINIKVVRNKSSLTIIMRFSLSAAGYCLTHFSLNIIIIHECIIAHLESL